MLRHDFQPGRLVAGAFLTATGALYAGDAAGLWDTPWFALIPLVVGGLCLAAVVGVIGRGIRRRGGAGGRGHGDGPAGDPAL
ncbi:hypothetical protein [Streptomyces griseosporeus]|uniref:hypothetical protein n=1 Tax=Streptomyces griseosporeus TaxID=1910 RepID=UPI0036FFBA95